jgi:hypothetical protein
VKNKFSNTIENLKNNTIAEIILDDWNITENNLQDLTYYLKYNQSLTTLVIENCTNIYQLEAILKSISRHPKIHFLKFCPLFDNIQLWNILEYTLKNNNLIKDIDCFDSGNILCNELIPININYLVRDNKLIYDYNQINNRVYKKKIEFDFPEEFSDFLKNIETYDLFNIPSYLSNYAQKDFAESDNNSQHPNELNLDTKSIYSEFLKNTACLETLENINKTIEIDEQIDNLELEIPLNGENHKSLYKNLF